MARETVLQCEDIAKSFIEGEIAVDVLTSVTLEVYKGEQIAIVGASGSGKSTLLHVLGGLTAPSKGCVMVDDKDINKMSEKAKGLLRNRALGFVYQFHHLLPEFSAQENVAMPLLIRREDPDNAMQRAADLLSRVGLEQRLHHKPGELSGGERQRAAVARALVTNPLCVLADEPTGNLDQRTANSVHDLMLELNQSLQTSLVIVTHDMSLAGRMQRIYQLNDGQLSAL